MRLNSGGKMANFSDQLLSGLFKRTSGWTSAKLRMMLSHTRQKCTMALIIQVMTILIRRTVRRLTKNSTGSSLKNMRMTLSSIWSIRIAGRSRLESKYSTVMAIARISSFFSTMASASLGIAMTPLSFRCASTYQLVKCLSQR